MTILAIDPGASGGMAWHNDLSSDCFAMPKTDLEVIQDLAVMNTDVVYVERVSGFIGHPHPGGAMFKFGRGYGFILGALMAFGRRVILVSPQAWQKHLSIGTSRGLKKTEWKRKLMDEAKRRFPDVQSISLRTADALLILDYAIRQEKANNESPQR
jgi:hypothetical protein